MIWNITGMKISIELHDIDFVDRLFFHINPDFSIVTFPAFDFSFVRGAAPDEFSKLSTALIGGIPQRAFKPVHKPESVSFVVPDQLLSDILVYWGLYRQI